MKTTVHKRLARFAGLLLLSLLVVATGVQAAQASTRQGTGAAGGDSTSVSQTPPIQLQGLTEVGRGGVDLAPFTPASGTQPASSTTSTTSSTTAWIVGTAAAVLIVGIASWALMRRRRQPGELASAGYCSQHSEDSLCRAA